MKLNVSLFFFCLFPSVTFAEKKAVVLSPSLSSAELIKLFLSLTTIIALILILAFLFRKFSQFSISSNQLIKILSVVGVGGREKIMLIEVADKTLLIGVTANGITRLESCEGIVETTSKSTNKERAFLDVLKQTLKGTSYEKDR